MCHPCVGVIRYLRQNHFRFYSFYCTIWWHALFRYRQYKYTVEYHSLGTVKNFIKKFWKRKLNKFSHGIHLEGQFFKVIFEQNFDRKHKNEIRLYFLKVQNLLKYGILIILRIFKGIGDSFLLWSHHSDEFFIVNLSVTINIGFTNHLVNFFVC